MEGTDTMSTSQPSGGEASSAVQSEGVSINLLSLANAVDEADTPAFVKARLAEEPARLTLAEFRSLDAPEREALLRTVQKAIAHYRARAESSARGTSQPGRTADDLQAFADAATASP